VLFATPDEIKVLLERAYLGADPIATPPSTGTNGSTPA
jgi:hypothetical protein